MGWARSVRLPFIVSGRLTLAAVGHGLAENSGFVYLNGTQFMLQGRPIFPTGTNSYYQMVYRRWQAPGPDEVLDKVQARRMILVRTWAFQDAVEVGACLQCAPARKLLSNERPVDFIDPDTLAAHPNVQFNFYRPGIGTCEVQMH